MATKKDTEIKTEAPKVETKIKVRDRKSVV